MTPSFWFNQFFPFECRSGKHKHWDVNIGGRLWGRLWHQVERKSNFLLLVTKRRAFVLPTLIIIQMRSHSERYRKKR